MRTEEPRARSWLTTLTAAGRGAIGVVAVWGPGALAAADAAFRPARGPSLAATRPGRPRLGRVGRGLGDEVVAVVLDESPPSVEIQCHGGAVALALVIEALQAAGAEAVEPARWAERQAGSPLRAAALVDLASAPTVRAASILLDQAGGALDREIEQLRQGLVGGAASGALEGLDRLIERGRIGVKLLPGWRVVIRGRPNVGKSRLLNALAGYQRAIVDPTPGTTRDVVTVVAAFDGWPVQLIDTAGIRAAEDDLEQAGIERAAQQAEAADLVLLVLDRSEPLREEDHELLSGASAASAPAMLVANKADLPAAWAPEDPALAGPPIQVVSAECGEGLDGLIPAIVERLVPKPTAPGAGVPFRPEQLEFLRAAAHALARGDVTEALTALPRVGAVELARGAREGIIPPSRAPRAC
jgi:tRNA modification GTPase